MKKLLKNKFISDLFSNFEFDAFSNSDPIDPGVRLEYIKEMISHAKSDKQAVFMYIAISLAAAVFLIDKLSILINDQSYWSVVLYFVGITLLIIAAVFFFAYWRKVHKIQASIISCIPTLNIERTRDLWIQLWQEHKRYFKLGLLLFSSGSFLVFVLILVSKIFALQ